MRIALGTKNSNENNNNRDDIYKKNEENIEKKKIKEIYRNIALLFPI